MVEVKAQVLQKIAAQQTAVPVEMPAH